jgi:hypothetical protein
VQNQDEKGKWMSRREAILLVSRALAVMQLIGVLFEVTYLPERFLSLQHHATGPSVLSVSSYDVFWAGYYRVAIGALLLRILIGLLLAVVFWNCGPWIERLLLTDREKAGPAA